MSLEKAIKHGREHRKPYRGQRKSCNIDRSCRNHGRCPWCESARLYQNNKAKAKADDLQRSSQTEEAIS
jgi:hypothetical protein